jgi:hypothetical protein
MWPVNRGKTLEAVINAVHTWSGMQVLLTSEKDGIRMLILSV